MNLLEQQPNRKKGCDKRSLVCASYVPAPLEDTGMYFYLFFLRMFKNKNREFFNKVYISYMQEFSLYPANNQTMLIYLNGPSFDSCLDMFC